MAGVVSQRALRRCTFSGIQPTGIPHLGNYFGALSNWVTLQNESNKVGDGAQTIYSIVDLHAMSMPYDSTQLRRKCVETAAALMACGISPQQSILFRQSAVREHTELAWTLGCVTPLGWLQRMTQYKSKGSRDKASAGLGLLSYPVLQVGYLHMQGQVLILWVIRFSFKSRRIWALCCFSVQAADILLYGATHVPVGEDQLQHLELARSIAEAFNSRFGPVFHSLPQSVSLATGACRIMSLRDGTKKARVSLTKCTHGPFPTPRPYLMPRFCCHHVILRR